MVYIYTLIIVLHYVKRLSIDDTDGYVHDFVVAGVVAFLSNNLYDNNKVSLMYSASSFESNSCIAIDRLMIELLDFHIPFLSFTNAGFKGYGKNLLNRRLRITQLP